MRGVTLGLGRNGMLILHLWCQTERLLGC